MRKLLWEKKFGDKIETSQARGLGFPGGSDGKECGRPRFDPWVEKIPWRREWQPTPVSNQLILKEINPQYGWKD